MDKILKNILKKIENAGFEAYLVGGYVRDYLLGIKSLDVDICTNALPKDLHKLFQKSSSVNNYGGFNLKIKNYNIDITTYRKELRYVERKPVEIVYVNTLEEDIIRRDFTINAICMDKDEKIIDLLNGIEDLNKRVIKMIGNPNERLKEDPLRILRAIRFAANLNFDLDPDLLASMQNNYQLLGDGKQLFISAFRIKTEFNKILLNQNYLVGLNLLDKCHILEILHIKYHPDMVYVQDISGMWAQLDVFKYYAFTKQEIRNIINIKAIIKNGNIDNRILYDYGLYTSLVAGEILNLNKKAINKMYEKLPLKTKDDLKITSQEIMNILEIKPSKKVKEIKDNLINLVLMGKLKNNNKILREYVLKEKEV